MTDIAPGYAPLEERRDRRPPVGGVPLFPSLQVSYELCPFGRT